MSRRSRDIVMFLLAFGAVAVVDAVWRASTTPEPAVTIELAESPSPESLSSMFHADTWVLEERRETPEKGFKRYSAIVRGMPARAMVAWTRGGESAVQFILTMTRDQFDGQGPLTLLGLVSSCRGLSPDVHAAARSTLAKSTAAASLPFAKSDSETASLRTADGWEVVSSTVTSETDHGREYVCSVYACRHFPGIAPVRKG